MFKQLFSFFSTSKKRRRGSRKTRKLRTTRKLGTTRKMRGGWGGAEPVAKKSGSLFLMKGGWGEPIILK